MEGYPAGLSRCRGMIRRAKFFIRTLWLNHCLIRGDLGSDSSYFGASYVVSLPTCYSYGKGMESVLINCSSFFQKVLQVTRRFLPDSHFKICNRSSRQGRNVGRKALLVQSNPIRDEMFFEFHAKTISDGTVTSVRNNNKNQPMLIKLLMPTNPGTL